MAGLGEAVLEGLEHRSHRRDRRPQIVAGPCDELAPGVEDQLHLLGHLVERPGEPRELLRAILAGPNGEVAGRDLRRGVAETPDPLADVAGEEQRGEQRRRGRSDCDREQLDVVPHVEHHPPREEDDRERQHDGEECKCDELAAHRREDADPGDEHQPRHQGQDGEPEAGSDHGTSL